MDKRENTIRRARQDQDGERLERSATEIIVGLGAPAIISAGVIGAKLIDRLPKKEEGESKKDE